MKGLLVTIGIILLVIGIGGFMASYTITWMSVLVILGLVAVLMGYLSKSGESNS